MIENTLWVEKYRPQTLEEYIGNTEVKSKINNWLQQGDVPSMLFSGPAGTGKTTLAKIIGRHLDCDILYINASDENNVDTVRDKIKGFATSYGSKKWKLVILDEADFLTTNAQAALRQVIEAFSRHCRFILTCNYVERIIDAIQSRCVGFHIIPPNKADVAKRCIEILKSENVKFDSATLVKIVNSTYPDSRRTINALQRNTINGELQIDEITAIAANYMTDVVNELKKATDSKTAFKNIRQIIADSKNRTFELLYRHLFDNLDEFVPDGKKAICILHIAESQYRSAFAVDKEIEISALIINLLKELK